MNTLRRTTQRSGIICRGGKRVGNTVCSVRQRLLYIPSNNRILFAGKGHQLITERDKRANSWSSCDCRRCGEFLDATSVSSEFCSIFGESFDTSECVAHLLRRKKAALAFPMQSNAEKLSQRLLLRRIEKIWEVLLVKS